MASFAFDENTLIQQSIRNAEANYIKMKASGFLDSLNNKIMCEDFIKCAVEFPLFRPTEEQLKMWLYMYDDILTKFNPKK